MIIENIDLIRQAMVIKREIKNLQALTMLRYSPPDLDLKFHVDNLEVNISAFLSHFASYPSLDIK